MNHVRTATPAVEPTPPVARIGCYGWVSEHAGSVASAGYVALTALTRRGVHVDLFAHRDYVPEPAGLRGPNFAYHGFRQPRWLDAVDLLPDRAEHNLRRLIYPATSAAWRRVLGPAAQAQHRRDAYDVLLFLGTPPVFGVPGVPVVTWLQSPFHTEIEAIRRLKAPILATVSRPTYSAVTAWHRWHGHVLRHNPIRSDRYVLPSQWSRRAMIEHEHTCPPIDAIPYPIDLDAFRPQPAADRDPSRPLLVALGRIDPRKRVDLLFDAFPIIQRSEPAARLLLVGDRGSFPGRLSLLEQLPEGVERRERMPRQEVPALMREAAVLVQPSENENFGSAVAEAMACGTPVVVGPSNGTAEYVDEHSAVFAEYTPECLAEAVLGTLRRAREEPDDVRSSARRSAERWFSPAYVADRLIAVLTAAIAGHDGARAA